MLKSRVIEAYNYAKEAHNGQKRKFVDKDYFVHVKYVARIMEDLTHDEDLVIAALLHDTVEDTKVSELDIRIKFGDKIANLVIELTSYKAKDACKVEYLSNKMCHMSTNALTIKLGDRWHNVMFLDKDCKTKEHLGFVKKYVKETETIMGKISDSRELNSPCSILFRKIVDECDYLKLKHLF